MFNREWGNMPQEIRSILEQLIPLESVILENPDICRRGETIIDSMQDIIRRNPNYQTYPINVIPSGVHGECERVLLVAVGSDVYEDVEKRILQAIEHIFVNCPDDTEFVIFWAAKWDSAAWMRHIRSFEDVTVILKAFLASPARLTPRAAKKKK